MKYSLLAIAIISFISLKAQSFLNINLGVGNPTGVYASTDIDNETDCGLAQPGPTASIEFDYIPIKYAGIGLDVNFTMNSFDADVLENWLEEDGSDYVVNVDPYIIPAADIFLIGTIPIKDLSIDLKPFMGFAGATYPSYDATTYYLGVEYYAESILYDMTYFLTYGASLGLRFKASEHINILASVTGRGGNIEYKGIESDLYIGGFYYDGYVDNYTQPFSDVRITLGLGIKL